ncbi:MAG: hypothetical protein ACU0CO_13595 [Shimia sp.]
MDGPPSPAAPRLGARYAAGAALMLGGLYAVARFGMPNALWLAGATVAAAVPVFVWLCYVGRTRQAFRAGYFARGSLLRTVFGGWLLRVIGALVVATLAALGLLAKMGRGDPVDLALAAAAVIVLPLMLRPASRLAARNIAPGYAKAAALSGAAWLSAIALAALATALTLGEAVPAAWRATLSEGAVEGASALWRVMGDLATTLDDAETALAGIAHRIDPRLGAALLFALNLASFLAICWTLAALLLTGRDVRRALTPVGDGRGTGALALQAAVLTVFVAFLLLPGMAALERAAGARGVTDAVERISRLPREVERLGETYVAPGTLAALDGIDAEWRAGNAATVEALSREVDAAFDAARAQVDPFLDWYYTLTGEYVRTAALLTGRGEEVIARRMEGFLAGGPDGAALPQSVRAARAAMARDRAAREAAQADLLAQNEVTLAPEERPVVTEARAAPPADLTQLTEGMEARLTTRLGTAGAAMTAGGAVAALATRKLVAKGVVRTATKAVGRAAAGRAAGGGGGATAGAAAGAAAGSVIPGLGTAAGAVVGGIVGGIAAGLAVDAVLIEVEEYFGRAAFRAEIMAAIADSEAALRAELGLPEA